MIAHAFNYTTQDTNKELFECFDCAEKFGNKPEQMSHKTEKHYKTRLCSYFHGNKTTCRFPAQQCLNIHNENIHVTEAVSDYRSQIVCKHGSACMFLARPGGCLYKYV